MDVSSIASVATELSQTRTADAVSIAVLRKALDIQEQGALQLIAALPLPPTSNPPNLGNTINTFA